MKLTSPSIPIYLNLIQASLLIEIIDMVLGHFIVSKQTLHRLSHRARRHRAGVLAPCPFHRLHWPASISAMAIGDHAHRRISFTRLYNKGQLNQIQGGDVHY